MADTIYDDGALDPLDKLGMVNICLQSIGELPLEPGTVLAELQPGTDAYLARDLVTKAMVEVQRKGYFFNTDYNFTFIPDQDGFIVAPANLLRIDVGNTGNRSKIILQQGKFYNTETQDYIFSKPVKANAIWLKDYNQLPYTAWNYIALVAARNFELSVLNSPDVGSSIVKRELVAREELIKEHLQYRDINLIK